MRCRTISLDKTSSAPASVGHGPLNARRIQDAVNTALEAIEAEGNRIVAVHMLGSKLGPGEVVTIDKAMLMILFEPKVFEMPTVEIKETTLHPGPAPGPGRPIVTCGSGDS